MPKLIKLNEAKKVSEYDVSQFSEYDIANPNLSVGISEINGRYPASGFDADTGIEQIWYVISGQGIVSIKDGKTLQIQSGDMLHIERGEGFVIEGNLKLVVSSSPAWTPEQHKHIE